MANKVYKWTDDPMLGGISDCDPDVVNDCLMSLKYENTSDAIQNMYMTGQVETQTRAFEQLKAMKRSTFDSSKFTVVGSPTITDDGVASYCNNSNEVDTSTFNVLGNNKIVVKTRFKQVANTSCILMYGYEQGFIAGTSGYLLIKTTNDNKLQFGANAVTTGAVAIPNLNLPVDIILELDSITQNATLKAYQNNTLFDTIIRAFSDFAFVVPETIQFKIGRYGNEGVKYDLKQFSITVDRKEVFLGNKTGIDVIKPDNYEVVGTPVISNDGVASGFSDSGYVRPVFDRVFSTDDIFGIYLRFKIPNSVTTGTKMQHIIHTYGAYGFIGFTQGSNGRLSVFIQPHGTVLVSYNCNLGDIFDVLINYTGTQILINTSINGVEQATVTSAKPENAINLANCKIWTIGNNNKALPAHYTFFEGSIDLNAFKICNYGNLAYQPCLKIPYTETAGKYGSKIVDSTYRDRVIDCYEQDYPQKYYTIDEENQNFTLPMGEIYGMIESKGSSSYQPPLLSTMWSDHLLNDMSWLRADTFSWQDGNANLLVYNELLSEYNNSASITEIEGSITFKRTPKGYKIALADQETAIAKKYATHGIAWYYILDTENKRFKLPRTKFGFEGYRNDIGGDIDETVPNINATFTANQLTTPTATGAISVTQRNVFDYHGDFSDNNSANTYKFNANDSCSSYQDNAPVQERATQMYLYFYVGAFTKSAESQTAGLKAELLNKKLDVSAIKRYSVEVSDKSLMPSWYVVYNDGWCEQGGIVNIGGDTSINITLLKNFADTNYNTRATLTRVSQNTDNGCGAGTNKTISSFNIISTCDTATTVNWYACGYVA